MPAINWRQFGREKKANQIVLKGLKYFVVNREFCLLHGKSKEIPPQAKKIWYVSEVLLILQPF